MSSELVIPVGDLAGVIGKERALSGEQAVHLRLGESEVSGPMRVTGVVSGLSEGVTADFEVSAVVRLECVRCLDQWEETITVEGRQFFGRDPDEDGYGLVDDHIDLTGPAQDELALALPVAPLCREDCKGLCPICGTDLNKEPCDGHGEDSDSPFAVLKDLFDS